MKISDFFNRPDRLVRQTVGKRAGSVESSAGGEETAAVAAGGKAVVIAVGRVLLAARDVTAFKRVEDLEQQFAADGHGPAVQRVQGIAGPDRDLPLGDDVTGVDVPVHHVHGHPRGVIGVGQGPEQRLPASMPGQERRMVIDRPLPRGRQE